ncbi:MAG: carbohydrate ABC transporter permease [Hyphomicrobiales bacterium]|nr:carbohydrate ABC transporter permease [Hyphomicrobiales bacterium]
MAQSITGDRTPAMPAPSSDARMPRRRQSVLPPETIKFSTIYLVLGLYCLFSLVVFLWVVLTSLKTNTEILMFPPWHLPKELVWQNLVDAWNRGVGTMFRNSMLIAGIGTIASVTLSAFAAYPIARIPFKLSHPLLMFFLIGIMIPYPLTAIPLFNIIEQLRQAHPWLNAYLILIVLYTASGVSFNTYVMTGFYKTLPFELEEAAALDGASPLRTFLQVMLPLARPGIASLLILNFVTMWNEFFYALLFIRERSQYTVTLGLTYLDQQAIYSGKWVGIFAGMTLTMIPVLIIFALLQRQIRQGLTVGALKG